MKNSGGRSCNGGCNSRARRRGSVRDDCLGYRTRCESLRTFSWCVGFVHRTCSIGTRVILIGGTALYAAWDQDWGGIRSRLSDLWVTLEPIVDAARELGYETLETLWNWVVGGLDQLSSLKDDFVPWLQSLPKKFDNAVEWAINLIEGLVLAPQAWLVQAREWAINFIEGKITAAQDWLIQARDWVINFVEGKINAAISWLEQSRDWAINFIEGKIDAAHDWLEKPENGLSISLKAVCSLLTTGWNRQDIGLST